MPQTTELTLEDLANLMQRWLLAKAAVEQEPGLLTPRMFLSDATHELREALCECPKVQEIDIVFDGPPSHESGRFVETETIDGKGIRVGEWHNRGDGYWVLRVPMAVGS